MKRISRVWLHICILVMLLTLHTQAQMVTGLNRDSLRRVLHALPVDTNKVMAFITLGQQYENNIPDSALYYYEQAQRLSVQLHYPAGFVRYVNNYTAVLNMQGRYNESLKLDLQAVDTCRRYGLQELLVKVLINDDITLQESALMSLGNGYKRVRYYDKYLAAFRSALPLARMLDDVNGQAIAMQGITEGLYWTKQYRQAAISADTALAYAKVHD
ncbi:hypothetical protein [Chitinophaga sp. GbtcB8]|uniref:hypothetical protein n=1 Tax=Chitinophaga sp. GbtcB8 TaxID=2824753 RepID=UPI001C308707|nr:hypothetical protein [Chitinophaga sp. GbtcB8]